MKTFSRPLFDEDSIALVSAGSLALVFELRCILSKFLKNRKKCHRSDRAWGFWWPSAACRPLVNGSSARSACAVLIGAWDLCLVHAHWCLRFFPSSIRAFKGGIYPPSLKHEVAKAGCFGPKQRTKQASVPIKAGI